MGGLRAEGADGGGGGVWCGQRISAQVPTSEGGNAGSRAASGGRRTAGCVSGSGKLHALLRVLRGLRAGRKGGAPCQG